MLKTYIYTFWEPWPEPLGTKNRKKSLKIHKNFMDFEGGARGPRSPPPRVEKILTVVVVVVVVVVVAK